MKRFLSIFLTAIMVLSLCACSGSTGGGGGSTGGNTGGNTGGGGGGGDTPAPEAGAFDVTEPITIVWWHALEDQYTESVKEIVDAFNNSQDLITVEAQYIGSYSQINEALVAAHAAGSGLPALCVANTDYVAQYGAGGVYEDLGPYIAATGYDVDDFSKGLILSSQYNGKQVAMPFLHSTQVIYYNKTMADANNIAIPTKIEDFQAFLEAGKAATGGGTGTVVPGWDQWYFETLYLNEGVKIITDDNTCDLNSDTALAMTNQIKAWKDAGLLNFAVGPDASAEMRQSFYDGKTFSVLHTSSLYNNYVDNCDFEVGMAWYPAASTGTKNSEVGGCVLGIPAKNDQATKNAAWVFLQYLVGKDVNMKWARVTGYMPTRNSVLTTQEGVDFLAEKPAFQCVFDNLDLINPRIQNAAWAELANIWKDFMDRMINQNAAIDSSSNNMVEEIDEILADSAG